MLLLEKTLDIFGYDPLKLSKYSHKKIYLCCDFCKESYISSFHTINYKSTSLSSLHACNKCKYIKIAENWKTKYSDPKYFRYNTLDVNFFQYIDSENKAYWLGFLAADGNITKNFTRLQLSLGGIDIQHIEKFKLDIKSNNKIHHRKIGTVMMSIYNKIFVSHLSKFNITPNKSLNLNLNLDAVPNTLLRHFWRGVVDGDGWLSKRKNTNRWQIGLCDGGIITVTKFRDYISQILQIQANITSSRKIWIVKYDKQDYVKRIVHLLYNDSTIFLDRKMNLANQIIFSKTP